MGKALRIYLSWIEAYEGVRYAGAPWGCVRCKCVGLSHPHICRETTPQATKTTAIQSQALVLC
jgi:hypothetical protein